MNKFSCSVYNQWEMFGCNWHDFNLIHLSFEWTKILGSVELDIGLLGLNLHLAYQYAETEELLKLRAMVDEIESGSADTKPWE